MIVTAWQPVMCRFLSTLSVRRATETIRQIIQGKAISIHALREESDPRP